MTAIERARADGRLNALRAALTDDNLETLLEAMRLALEAKRAAMRDAVAAGLQLDEEDFGIPRFEAINAQLAAAYDLEPQT